MNTTMLALIAAFAVLLILCGICGYRRRVLGFVTVMVTGWTLNLLWMIVALNAGPLDMDALTAQGALFVYGLCGFATGWMISRITTKFRETTVEE